MLRTITRLLIVTSFCVSGSRVYAAVVISSDATQNMICSDGVCAPTATDAVLNAGDLEALLASGDVTVTTTGSGVEADDIRITSAVAWNTGSALALDAFRSLVFDAAVSVEAPAGLSLTTNDGGTGGTLSFEKKGRAIFGDTSSNLAINGIAYRLVGNLKDLASDIVRKAGGSYALADNYDAGADGVYTTSPVANTFHGSFSGLGNKIARLQIADATESDNVGLFSHLGSAGVIADVRLSHTIVKGGMRASVGGLVGLSDGTISNAYVEGRIRVIGGYAGAVAGYNNGEISRSRSAGHVSESGTGDAGGLVGDNYGSIVYSQSDATVHAAGGYDNEEDAGGLVGANFFGELREDFATGQVEAGEGGRCGGLSGGDYVGGNIVNSYATGNESASSDSSISYSYVGGLIGYSYNGSEGTSFSTGVPHGRASRYVGGFFGADEGSASFSYWDTTTSGTEEGAGDGNEAGITGLTTRQLQSGLPQGFDPNIWAQSRKINNGLPYLINNPPRR